MLVRFVVSKYQALSAPIDFEILNSAQRLDFLRIKSFIMPELLCRDR